MCDEASTPSTTPPPKAPSHVSGANKPTRAAQRKPLPQSQPQARHSHNQSRSRSAARRAARLVAGAPYGLGWLDWIGWTGRSELVCLPGVGTGAGAVTPWGPSGWRRREFSAERGMCFSFMRLMEGRTRTRRERMKEERYCRYGVCGCREGWTGGRDDEWSCG
jgi:hypothetical protein